MKLLIILAILSFSAAAYAEAPNPVLPTGAGWFCFEAFPHGQMINLIDGEDIPPVLHCSRTLQLCEGKREASDAIRRSGCDELGEVWVFTFSLLDKKHEKQPTTYLATRDKKACKTARTFYRDKMWQARDVSFCKKEK